jgi:hypothetical protein
MHLPDVTAPAEPWAEESAVIDWIEKVDAEFGVLQGQHGSGYSLRQ